MKDHKMRFFVIFALIMANVVCLQGQRQAKNPSFEAYINKYKDLAIQLQKEYKIPASVKLAQGLLETGGGSSRLATIGNNHFGIKCKEDWRGGRMYHDDDAKGECFRTYKSAQDSYLDHALFLSQRPFYVSLFKLDIYDYKGWAYGLQSCGYATDKQYGEKLVRLIEAYELYKYDKAQVTEKRPIRDDIYEIKLNTPEIESKKFDPANWRRRLQKTNGIYFITARANDTYEALANETRMKLKTLLKYNETTADQKLSSGDYIFMQKKKNQADKAHSTHTVKAGESLYSISQMYGIKVKSLYKFNKLKDDYVPKPGDILKVRKKN